VIPLVAASETGEARHLSVLWGPRAPTLFVQAGNGVRPGSPLVGKRVRSAKSVEIRPHRGLQARTAGLRIQPTAKSGYIPGRKPTL